MTANQPHEHTDRSASSEAEEVTLSKGNSADASSDSAFVDGTIQKQSVDADAIDESDPFEDLATEFAARIRSGERPSIEKYASGHPEIADEIRELFPTIAAMEQTKARQLPPKRAHESLPMERLGDFRMLGEIGRGGMGIVYEAEQVSLGRRVAVKVLPKQALLDERHLRRFEREAQTAAKLHHTNIVPVFGVGQQEGYNYIVMQFIPGVGLDEVLLALRQQVFHTDQAAMPHDSSSRGIHATQNARAILTGEFGDHVPLSSSSFQRESSVKDAYTQTAVQRPQTDGFSNTLEISASKHANANDSAQAAETEFTVSSISSASDDEAKKLATLDNKFYQSVATIGQQVADALAYAHEQETLHRDIKPGNLLLDGTGTVWVADFGLAKLVEQDNVSRTGDVVGTLSYIPPESFSQEADARGDLYSLGLSLFELLTLRPAFYGRDRGKLVRNITEGNLPKLRKLNPGIPRDLETIISKAVSLRPEDRYATAREMADDLDSFLHDMPIKARPMSIPEQFTRWCRKNKLVASLSAAVLSLLMVLTVVFGIAAWSISKERDIAQQQTDYAQQQTVYANQQRDDANQQRDNAKEIAREALNSIIAIFRQFTPFRLPISASDSLATSNLAASTNEQGNTNTAESEAENTGSVSQEDTASVMALVASAPIKADTAELLESLLVDLDKLIQRADQDEDLAPLSAKFTLYVAKSHKTLANYEKATKYFDDAIASYQRLGSLGDSVAAATGLAVCLNEKGDMLAQRGKTAREAEQLYREAHKLLEGRQDLDARANYELARTLFLMSVRRGKSPGFAGNWVATKYLDDAIKLLQPMVDTEANPEYRYLLARCYTGKAIAARGDEKTKVYFVDQAINELSKLAEQVEVADYQYEFALAKQSKASLTANHTLKRRLLREATELLDGICSSQPTVCDYQIARSRALEQYAEFLDQMAMLTETLEENNPLSFVDRMRASEVAARAHQAYFNSKVAFGENFTTGLPPTHLSSIARVLSHVDPEFQDPQDLRDQQDLAAQVYREALGESPDELSKARAKLGLARLLNQSSTQLGLIDQRAEAVELLDELKKRLQVSLKREMDHPARRGGRRSKFPPRLIALTLLCQAIYERSNYGQTDYEQTINQQLALIEMESVIEKYRNRRFKDDNRNDTEAASFQLVESQLYLDIGRIDKGLELQKRSLANLERIFASDEKADRHSRAGTILRDFYRQLGEENNYDSVQAMLDLLPPPRGLGGRRSGN